MNVIYERLKDRGAFLDHPDPEDVSEALVVGPARLFRASRDEVRGSASAKMRPCRPSPAHASWGVPEGCLARVALYVLRDKVAAVRSRI
jgi:hypothetical protein